jgi:hypothetical protein
VNKKWKWNRFYAGWRGRFFVLWIVSFCASTPLYAGMQKPVDDIPAPSESDDGFRDRVYPKQTVILYSGSLRDNLSRIAKLYSWKKLVWLPESDYQWVGQVTMREQSIESLFQKILYEYPVQAVFYRGNHVLVIRPRNT